MSSIQGWCSLLKFGSKQSVPGVYGSNDLQIRMLIPRLYKTIQTMEAFNNISL